MTIKKFRELRRRQKEVRRQTIVDIAEDILVKKGFEAVTIRSVAKTAGLSVGSIYMYFKNKEELFLCMLLGHLEKLDKAFAASMQEPDPAKAMRALALDYRGYYLSGGRHINALGYVYEERTRAGEINPDLLAELQDILGCILGRIEELLKRPGMEKVLKGLDPARGIPVLWSIMAGIAELTLPSPRANQAGFDFDQVLDDVLLLFFG